jgi:hypothetical protein
MPSRWPSEHSATRRTVWASAPVSGPERRPARTAGAVVQRVVFGAEAESARMVARPFVARILVHSDCVLVRGVDSVTRTVIGHLRVFPAPYVASHNKLTPNPR